MEVFLEWVNGIFLKSTKSIYLITFYLGAGSQKIKIKDGFIYTNLKNNPFKYQDNNKAIFISTPLERYSCKTQSWPAGASQSYKFMNEHIGFFKNLSKDIQNNFVFRILKKTDDLFKTNYVDRIEDNFRNIEIDYGDIKLSKVLNNFKLACIAYNSTTNLQTLSMNFPTVMYWNDSYFELNNSSKKYFEELKVARIFHTNHISASKHVNSIWNNIDPWWESDIVQNARKLFCANYAKVNNNKKIMN